MVRFRALYGWLLLLSSVCFQLVGSAQQSDSLRITADSIQQKQPGPGVVIDSERISRRIDSVRRTQNRNDTALVNKLNKMEDYANVLSNMANKISRMVDTTEMLDALSNIEDQILLAKEGINSRWHEPNLRNMVATKVLLTEVLRHLESWQKTVSVSNKELVIMRQFLDSLRNDSALRVVPRDSALAQQYSSRIVDLLRRYKPMDSVVNIYMIEVGMIQGRIVRNLLDVKDQLAVIDVAVKSMRTHYFNRDAPPIWASKGKHSISNVISTSLGKATLVLSYYLRSSTNATMLALLVFALLWLVIRVMKTKLQKAHKELVLTQFMPHVHRSAMLTALFVSLSVAQLLFGNVPMVFLQSLWILMWISITYLFWQDLNKEWQKVWIGFGLLFLWACLENLVLESSPFERWLMLLVSIGGMLLCIHMVRLYKKQNVQAPYFLFFSGLFMLQEGLAAIANMAGAYTFGRAMAVGGYFNLVIGFMFFHGITLVKELIVLSYEYYRRNDRLSSVVNLLVIKQRAEEFLPWVAWAGWFIVFAKNLNFYDVMIAVVKSFLTEERVLGNIVFSFSSVVIFFITIWLSTVIAQFVAFLLGGNNSTVSNIQKTRFSSLILVSKLGIISLGLIIAFAASGIPLDKITIIIGALGVGIGFGLQNIVNNLVSGVILAFEKPIQIGDQVEVGGMLGKIKEIGIRSSKLATFEGAEVIIPNGDLISQQVVNWTLSNNHRRVEIIVGVKYGSNLLDAKTILEKVLLDNEKVDKHPMPLVLVHQFNNSSIDFRLLFWTDISLWVELKSEIMLGVDQAFRSAGIEIPFPQQDVYIKQMPDTLKA
ncbi:MAG: mechanosensitive ion channel [Chitinophagaceae bacterium]|nr:mechanosensitive ion channel [Chitinophagaceae bacterium]